MSEPRRYRTITDDKPVIITVRMPASLKAEIVQLAHESNRSQNDVTVEAITEYLERAGSSEEHN